MASMSWVNPKWKRMHDLYNMYMDNLALKSKPIYIMNDNGIHLMTTSTQNKNGEWVPAIPEPYYGVRKTCDCGSKFWTYKGYQGHYALKHILGL
jgi:hypothetical protein